MSGKNVAGGRLCWVKAGDVVGRCVRGDVKGAVLARIDLRCSIETKKVSRALNSFLAVRKEFLSCGLVRLERLRMRRPVLVNQISLSCRKRRQSNNKCSMVSHVLQNVHKCEACCPNLCRYRLVG